jgi:hypothetical protein
MFKLTTSKVIALNLVMPDFDNIDLFYPNTFACRIMGAISALYWLFGRHCVNIGYNELVEGFIPYRLLGSADVLPCTKAALC